MLVFVSYSLRDVPVVKALIMQLGVLGHNVLYEPKMPAGQIRWDHVLDSIKACDVFLVALTPNVLRSESRALELQYARRLNKPVLAVLLEEIAETPPAELGQPLSYLSQSRQANDNLDQALKAQLRPQEPQPTDGEPEANPAEPDWRIPLMKLHTLNLAQSISLPEQQWLILNIQEFLERQETYRAARTLFKSMASRRDLDAAIQAEVEDTTKQLKQSYVAQKRARWRNIALISMFVLGVLVVGLFFLYRRQQAATREVEATQSEQAVQVTQTGFVLNKDMTNTAISVTQTAAARQTQTAMPTATLTLTPTLTQTPNARFIYESIFTHGLATPTPGGMIIVTQTTPATSGETEAAPVLSTPLNATATPTVSVTQGVAPTRTLLPPVTPGG